MAFPALTSWRMLLRMAVELSDSALMLRYRDGDIAAFDTLYGRHKGPLFRFLLRQTGNQQYAEDVFQDVWGRIIRNRNNYQTTAKFTTYLYHVARNCSADHHRQAGKRKNEISEHCAAAPEPVDHDNDPVRNAEAGDVLQAISAALQSLAPEQRETFLLKEESGLSLEEIATVTGVGRETVKSRLRYAVNKLRQCLSQPETAGVEDA